MTTNPNPGPDPAAVRAALAEIDEAERAWLYGPENTEKSVRQKMNQWSRLVLHHSDCLNAAARAWLEQQEAPCETESR